MKKLLILIMTFIGFNLVYANQNYLNAKGLNAFAKSHAISEFYTIALQNSSHSGLDLNSLDNLNQIYFIQHDTNYDNNDYIWLDKMSGGRYTSRRYQVQWGEAYIMTYVDGSVDLISQLQQVEQSGLGTKYLSQISIYKSLEKNPQDMLEFIFSPDDTYTSCYSVLYDLDTKKISFGDRQSCFFSKSLVIGSSTNDAAF